MDSNASIVSFISNSSFVNQHMSLDNRTNISYLDAVLVNNNATYEATLVHLYDSFCEDLLLQTTVYFLPFATLFQAEYQDTASIVTLLTPELAHMFNDYIYIYVMPSNFNVLPAAVLDSYLVHWVSHTGSGLSDFLLFWVYAWIFTYLLCMLIGVNWITTISAQFTRYYYYTYTISKEVRTQLEVVIQTIVFFIFYWVTTLMTFDDNQEEIIEFVDTSFFYFFAIVTFYVCFKYSIHYFTFLEASVTVGRSTGFLIKQVFKDFLNTLSLFLRFYILLLRANVYDTLDDFLDSYYIFIGYFDADEYINELLLSISGSLLFLSENDYDTSYFFKDEHDFFSDWFQLYFIVFGGGTLFYFTFFMLEEAARLSLAFYVTYLIVFEVRGVSSSYTEWTFFRSKRF
jgi:hypothetical protein